MVRIALSLLAAFFLSGCFVIDEIQKGNDLIDQHSTGWREEKKLKDKKAKELAENASASRDSPYTTWKGVKEKAQLWWQEALEEEAVTAEPTDTVVSCQLGGQVQFLRKSDCATRGGRAKAPRSEPERVPPSV